MSDERLNGRVVVSVSVTVELESWGPDCTVKQAYEQGQREAETAVRNALAKEHNMRVSGVTCCRVVIDAPKEDK